MNQTRAERWVEGYVLAWETNEPDDIGKLFAQNALYYTGPFDQPWRGREAIVEGWLNRRDQPRSWDFRYQVLACEDEVCIVRGWTQYHQPAREYSNIWEVIFDDQDRCTRFTEWWMQRP